MTPTDSGRAGLRSRLHRHDDQGFVLAVHPLLVSVIGGVFTMLVLVIGWFSKDWANNITTEIHLLRLSVEKQNAEQAANAEWKSSMSKWRDDADSHFRDVDNRLDTLPWSIRPPKTKNKPIARP